MPVIPRKRPPPGGLHNQGSSPAAVAPAAGPGPSTSGENSFFASAGEQQLSEVELAPNRLLESDARFAAFVKRERQIGSEYVINLDDPNVGRMRTIFDRLAREGGLINGNDVVCRVEVEDAGVASAAAAGGGVGPDATAEIEAQLRRKAVRHRLWMILAMFNYRNRQRIYEKTVGTNNSTLIIRTLIVLALLCAGLSWGWPLWNFLFHVETNASYKVLELDTAATTSQIKKAYRAMAMKWHPDQNPNCGMLCRNKMMEIQKAYDELIKLKANDSNIVSKQRQEYEDFMSQIIGFTVYRGFDMASSTIFLSAFWVERFLQHRCSKSFLRKRMPTIVLLLKIALMSIFTICTVIYVTGFQIMLLLMSLVRVAGLFRTSSGAQYASAKRAMKSNNFDSGLAFLFFVLPAAALHTIHFLFFEQYPRSDLYLFQLFYGLVFTCGHLVETAPNLFDNVRMMQCTVPPSYLVRYPDGSKRLSKWRMLIAQFTVLVNDLFAFASQVPFFYRVAALLLHGAFLVQFSMLPLQISGGHRRRKSEAARRAATKARTASAAAAGRESISGGGNLVEDLEKATADDFGESSSDGEDDEEEHTATTTGGSDGVDATATEEEEEGGDGGGVRRQVLKSKEARLVSRLDDVNVGWILVAQLRYPHRFKKAVDLAKARAEKEEIMRANHQPITQGSLSSVEVTKTDMDPLSATITTHDEVLVFPAHYLPKPPPPQRYRAVWKKTVDMVAAARLRESALDSAKKMIPRALVAVVGLALLIVLTAGSTERQTERDVAPYIHPQHSINSGEAEVMTPMTDSTVSFLVPDGMDAVRVRYLSENREKTKGHGGDGGSAGKKKAHKKRKGNKKKAQ